MSNIPTNESLEPIRANSNNNSLLDDVLRSKPINPKQGILQLEITKEVEIDGVGMGVLSDGTPFLSGRGLARLCGVSNSGIVEIGNDWNAEPQKPRVLSIKSLIPPQSESLESLYIVNDASSDSSYIYPDSTSLAILEYYAFDAGINVKQQARKNYRILAGKSLREFIYAQVGYDPSNVIPHNWKQFHDRVSLTYNDVPGGFFSVFKEIADMIVTLGQNGLHIDDTFIPDISVGMAWSKHWETNQLDDEFGQREKCDHNFPQYFPQASSNPQTIWCYPEQGLGEFRRWMREHYIGDGKFTRYLEGKVKKGELPPSFATLALAAYTEVE